MNVLSAIRPRRARPKERQMSWAWRGNGLQRYVGLGTVSTLGWDSSRARRRSSPGSRRGRCLSRRLSEFIFHSDSPKTVAISRLGGRWDEAPATRTRRPKGSPRENVIGPDHVHDIVAVARTAPPLLNK